ncbi:virulence-associated E family protein [Algiphilus sp.]|uniref:virulence-associated E family protein n=1 Tax=Algiphilus sp. TaxID=1872431 RepID=UPI0025BCCEF1|nr:virulence-associated E family protein [Algiphilus sp.]MCK5769487.1 hypothetical protein [Algiphilus sp.]
MWKLLRDRTDMTFAELALDGTWMPYAFEGSAGKSRRTGWQIARTMKLQSGTAALLLYGTKLTDQGAKRVVVGAEPGAGELDLVDAIFGAMAVDAQQAIRELREWREKNKGGKSSRAPPPVASDGWEATLATNKEGGYRVNLHNVITILTRHREWRGVLAFDTFGNQIVKRRETPYGGEPGPVEDTDVVRIAAWLAHPDTYGMTVGSGMVREALLPVAHENPVHPVREYLDGLQWDGQPRIATFFRDYCGVDATSSELVDYLAAVARCFFVSAIARVREPGCKADLMLILEGPQGAKKSTVVRELASAEWFAEAMESPANKDFYQSLQSRWIVEVAEMESFTKAEVGKIKQAISTQADHYRPSYGHIAQSFPRQCVFMGTTNEDAYLRDPTGARRFMPVHVTEIDIDAIRGVRDQLWAEAQHRYGKGEDYWTLPASAREEQAARYQQDVWYEPIVRYVEGHGPPHWYPIKREPLDETTTAELLSRVLDIDAGKQDRQSQMRAAAVLKQLGWVRCKVRRNGVTVWAYRRPHGTSSYGMFDDPLEDTDA